MHNHAYQEKPYKETDSPYSQLIERKRKYIIYLANTKWDTTNTYQNMRVWGSTALERSMAKQVGHYGVYTCLSQVLKN